MVYDAALKGRQRCYCHTCGVWFGATLGTPPDETGRTRLRMSRGSLRTAEEVTGHKYKAISQWLKVAAKDAEALSEVLVHDLRLSRLEVEEFWSFARSRVATSRAFLRARSAEGV